MNRLDAYRGAHAGADVVICGCGASMSDYAPAPETITIGVNDMARSFCPDYLMVLNPRHSFAPERWRVIEGTRAKALFSHLDLGPTRAPLVRFKLGQRGGVDRPAAGALHYTRNSPYAAVHLAALMGARRIGLIGVDFTDDHFFARTGTHGLSRSLSTIDAEYGALAAALKRHGIVLDMLSPISRLTSLPRRTGVPTPKERPMPARSPRHLVIPRSRSGPIGQLMDALATSALSLGHSVRRGPISGAPKGSVAVTWNGRSLRWDGPVIFCEHGWLPRAAYQISTKGINADSHIAPFAWKGQALDPDGARRVTDYLGRLRREALAARTGTAPKTPFYLVPLQMEYDTNLVRHAPADLRRMQGLIDRLSAANPPLPLIFKQHPADLRRGGRHMALRVRRKQDVLWAHGKGCVNTLLGSGRCAGIISVNSNVVHDGLVHDVPGLVLGHNVWPSDGQAPFLTGLPDRWQDLDQHLDDADARAARLAYAGHLMDAQWTHADARNPAKLDALLSTLAQPARANVPAPLPRLTAAPRTTARRAARRTVTTAPVGINIFARNRGWQFEEIKTQLIARARARGLSASSSDHPLPHAQAWIAIRTTEAGQTPDPSRTLVQVHDLADAADYAPGTRRADALRCARLQLVHDSQNEILSRVAAFDPLTALPVIAPVAASADQTIPTADTPFTLGWFGRPEQHGGRERHRPDLFTSALCGLNEKVRALLAGEGLEPHADILRAAGTEVVHKPLAACAMAHWPRLLQECQALVLTSDFDPAPPLLFEAVARRIPVIARPLGWAGALVPKDLHIHTADDIARAISQLQSGKIKKPAAAPEAMPRDAWLDQALDAACALAEAPGSKGAIAAE